MPKKRAIGGAMLLLGGLACYLGTTRLSNNLETPGPNAPLLPFEGGVVLVGLIVMVLGGVLFARSFLDFD